MRIETESDGTLIQTDQNLRIALTDLSINFAPKIEPLQLTSLSGLRWEYAEGNDRWRIRVCHGEENSLYQITLFGKVDDPNRIHNLSVCYPIENPRNLSNGIHHLELKYSQPRGDELYSENLELTQIIHKVKRTFFNGTVLYNNAPSMWQKYSPNTRQENQKKHDQLLLLISEDMNKEPEEFDVINGAQLSLYYSDFFTLCDLDIERFTTDPLDPTLVSESR